MNSRHIYREWVATDDLVCFTVVTAETDLYVRTTRDLSQEALASADKHRRIVERYLSLHPRFATSMEPCVPHPNAPGIVQEMARAAAIAGIGPMSAVAGAIAEAVARDLLNYSPEVIVENGGDIFIATCSERVIGVYAGTAPLSGQVGIAINPEETPLAICTSSGSFGHSLSLGKADVCIVLSRSGAIADALATSLCNRIRSSDDLAKTLDPAGLPPEMLGVLAAVDGQVGMQGSIRLVPIQPGK